MHHLRWILVILLLLLPSSVIATTAEPVLDIESQPYATDTAIEENILVTDMEVQPSCDAKPLDSLNGWVSYWDTDDVLNEIGSSTIPLSKLIYFAAYFNEDNQLFVPAEIDELKLCLLMPDDQQPVEYLSFVNDRLLEGGGAIQKDLEILRMLLYHEDTRQAHIDEIISLTQQTGLDGIEIDYETIGKDEAVLAYYTLFITELYEKTAALDMPLRVVLEPSIPFDQLCLPEGPEYVIMCYNLYGSHSGPGAKANPKFLKKVVAAAEALPGKKTFALSVGGYRWTEETYAEGLSFLEAVALLEEQSAVAYRDHESGAVYFTYFDADGKENEVWFADDETLRIWIDAIQEMGDYDIDIWRFGGNGPWINSGLDASEPEGTPTPTLTPSPTPTPTPVPTPTSTMMLALMPTPTPTLDPTYISAP